MVFATQKGVFRIKFLDDMKHFYSRFLMVALLSAMSLLTQQTIYAQQLPDSGFEDWSGASFNGVAQNKYWNLSNVDQAGLQFNFGEKTDGRTGFALRVYDKEVGVKGIATQTAPGYASLGTPWQEISGFDTKSASGGLDGGIKFTYRPDSLVVWIKRIGNNVTKENYNIVFYSWSGTSKGTSYKNQQGSCRETTHYDEESDIRQKYDANVCTTAEFAEQIAEGWIKEKKEYTEWTRISVPIKYMNMTQKPEKCNVILSAGNYPNFRDNSGIYDGNTLIVDDIELIYNSTIDELRINDTKVRGFSASTIDFTKANEKTSYSPAAEDFTLFRSGRQLDASEYTININGAAVDNDKPVIITVKSEDGKSSTTYNIKFTSTQSTNYRPESITYKLGDTEYTLPNWNASAFNYEVSLPFGTTATPQLVVVTAEASQTFKITQPSGPNGTGSVLMTAQSGASQTYTVKFSVAQLTDNTLKNILLNGEPLTGFSSTKNNYDVELPLGTSAAPKITWESNYANGAQTITLTSNELSGSTGKATITVKAPGNATTRTYTLNYIVKASSYALLEDLKVGGTTIDGFIPSLRSYVYDLPMGTKTLPAVTYTKGQAGQTITVDDSGIKDLSGDYIIKVVAEDGTTVNYYINFQLLKSSNVDLKAIYVNGTAIQGFKASTLEYSVEVPADRTEASVVTVDKGEDEQTVTIGTIQTPEGTITVKVAAADDKTRRTYTITTYQNKSSDNTLKEILVNGALIDGFSAATEDYTYTYSGTAPKVTYTLNDATATAIDRTRNGVVTITVTAQDGSKKIYTVTLKEQSVQLSDYAYLEAIYINGSALQGFVSTQLEYSNVAVSPFAKPTVTYDAKEGVTVKDNTTWNTRTKIYKTVLTVTAEDGKTTNSYTLNYVEGQLQELSNDASLKSLTYDGSSVSDFSASKLSYNVILPAGTTAAPAVAAVANHASAKVEITQASTPNGTATIKVTAEDGKTTSTYTISFSVAAQELSSDATLKDLKADGKTVEGFSADKLSYTITLPFNSQIPVVTATANHSAAKVDIQSAESSVTVKVTAENGNTQTYTVSFIIEGDTRSSDATLKDLKVGNATISGFTATTTGYNYEIPFGGEVPTVSATANDSKATVNITQAVSKTGKAEIVVTAENGTIQTYTVQFSEAGDPRSTDATLKDLKVAGVTISDFSAATTDYNYEIPFGGEVPEVSAVANDDKASVKITQAASKTGKATIVVTAENQSVKTYTVQFSEAGDTRSKDATLADLLVGGVTIDGFTANKTAYNYQVAFGGGVPEVSAVANDSKATVAVTQAVSVTGTATIIVTAENLSTKTYTVSFSEASDPRSTDATLKAISVDIEGAWSQTFRPAVTEYTYTLPVGTTAIPQVSAEVNNSKAEAAIQQAASTEGDAVITVQAEHPDYSRTYTVHFVVKQSSDATLKAIYLDGELIEGFNPQTGNYRHVVEYGGNIPSVTYDLSDTQYSKATITEATEVPGMTTIVVTAQDGTQKTYVVRFVEASDTRSIDATLSSLSISGNGEWNNKFLPGRTLYIYTLPAGTTEVPVVEYEVSDAGANALYNPAEQIPGTTTIEVIAENPDYITTYTIQFVLAKNTDATLADLRIDGLTIDGFTPEQTSYTYEVAFGTTDVPQVEATANDANAEVKVINAASLDSKTLVYVTAEDGSQLLYQVTFVKAADTRDNSTLLAGIYINGEELQEFNANLHYYSVELPAGTTEIPEVSVLVENQLQTVSLNYQGAELPTSAVITVTAENGDKGQYIVAFTVAKSQLALLDMIYVGGEQMPDFEPEKLNYNYNIGSAAQIPVITVDKQHSYQTVEISTPRSNDVVEIKVISEDHSQETIYTIAIKGNIVIRKYNPQLTSLSVNGMDVEGFNGSTFEYNISIAKNINSWENLIKYAVNADTKDVNLTPKTPYVQNGECLIILTAKDDSTVNTYKLNLKPQLDRNATLAKVLFNGNTYAEFDSEKYDYEFDFATPELTYEKVNDLQTVIYRELSGSTIVLDVYAEDAEVHNTYTFNFKEETVELNKDAGITDITIGDFNKTVDPATIDDYKMISFGSTEILWSLQLPEGVDTLPEISVTPSVKSSKVFIQKEFVDGKAELIIQVVPEDASWADAYKVEVLFAKSQVNTLNSISFGSTTVTSFPEPDVNGDIIIDAPTLPLGEDYPEVSWVVGEKHQTVSVLGNGSRQVVLSVRAQDENIDATNYIVNFTKGLSSETGLAQIFIDGVEHLVQPVITYNIAVGQPIPVVTYVTKEDTERVLQVNNGRKGVTLLVVAEDGNTNTYKVNFTFDKNNDATLKDLYVSHNGSFESIFNDAERKVNDAEWSDILPAATAQVPAVMPIPSDSNAVVTITYGLLGQATKIHVVAENGTDQRDYLINFDKEKSGDAKLKNVDIKDNTSFNFNPDLLSYDKIPVAYGTLERPAITWEKGDAGQKVEFTDAGLSGKSMIKVTSEDDKATNIYTFTFRRGGDSEQDNILKRIYVNGSEATEIAPQEYAIELPYGTQECVITYDSAYQGQTILVTNMGLNAKSLLRVYSNVSGVETTTYAVNVTVNKTPTASATSIMVDGQPIDGFNPLVYDYIYVVDDPDASTPEVIVNFDESNVNLEQFEDVNNVKHYAARIRDNEINEEFTYNVYFYYKGDDDKLNLDFEEWSDTQYAEDNRKENAKYFSVKPTGWYAPGDAVKSKAGDLIQIESYWSGEEVNSETEDVKNGSKSAMLRTLYSIPIAASMPGVISLTSQSYSLGTYHLWVGWPDEVRSSVSYNNPVEYRNTPDGVSIWHKKKKDATYYKVPGWTFFMQQTGTSNQKITIDKNSQIPFMDNWTQFSQEVVYPDGFLPAKLDIRLCASDTTPATMMNDGWTNTQDSKRYHATVLVDYMQFHYDSKISSGSVLNTDGSVSVNGNEIEVNITNSAFAGKPELLFVNEKPYYKHEIIWNDETYTSGTVRSYGEDLSYTDYSLTVNYAESSTTLLKDILVNGVSVGTQNIIDIPVIYGTTRLPKVEVVTSNAKQVVSVKRVGNEELPGNSRLDPNQLIFTVYASQAASAESDPHSTYTINFRETQASENKLVDIKSNGNLIEEPFDAEKTAYTTVCEYSEPFQTITYTKASDGQQVVMTIDSISDLQQVITLVVTPEDNSSKKTYTVTQNKNKPAESNGILNEVAVGSPVVIATMPDVMQTNKSDYATDPSALTSFSRAFVTDTVVQVIAADYIEWSVNGANGANNYRLNFASTTQAVDDAYLGKLVIDDNDQADLDNIYDFVAQAGKSIVATQKIEGQTITPSCSPADSVFTISVMSVDGGTQQDYSIKLKPELSDVALLSSLSAEGFTLTPDFDANITEYDLTLNAENVPQLMPRRGAPRHAPKKGSLLGILPAIIANAQGEVKSMRIDYDKNQILIDIIPENGNESKMKTYTINVKYQTLAPGLDGISVFGVSVPDFDRDKTDYIMELPNLGNDAIGVVQPVVGYVSTNIHQTVETNVSELPTYDDPGTIELTASIGLESKKYTVNYTYKPSDISNNAKLAKLEVNGFALSDINANDNPQFDVIADENGLVDVNPIRAELSQTVKVTKSGNQIFVDVTAQDGVTTNRYTLNITQSGSASDNTDIYVYINGKLNGGLTLLTKDDESANNIIVDEKADVNWLLTEKGQKVEISGTSEQVILDVTAPDGVTKAQYIINISYKISDYIYDLQSIRLDGQPLTAYEKMTPYQVTPAKFINTLYAYRIDLPVDRVDTLPTIDAVKAADYQVISWDTWWRGDEKNDTLSVVKITTGIKDRDDLPTRQYVLSFIKYLDTDASPANILIDNIPMEDFTSGEVVYDPAQHDYTVTLDTNAVAPVVTVALKQHQDTVSVNRTFNVTNNPYAYRTEFVIRAQAGNTDTYSVTINIPQDDRNTLSDLRVDGLTVKRETEAFTANQDFNPAEQTYHITYPALKDTTLKPVITYSAASGNAVVTLVEPQTYSDTARISVMPYYGEERIYKVYFSLLKDTVATLDDLQLDGATIAGFDSDKQTYNVELGRGTLELPAIEGFATSPRATVSVSAGSIVDRQAKATLVVTAESGAQRVYTIDFTVAVDNNVTLKGITIDNVELEEFLPNVNSYSLERDTLAEQVVIGLKADEAQTLSYEEKPLNDGGKSVTVTVTAESGDKGYYTLNFTMPVVIPEPVKLDSNAYLSMIYLGTEALLDFDKEILVYDINLPRGSEYMPTIDAIPESDKASVKIDSVSINDFHGQVNIVVTSEAKTTLPYTLRFTVAVDSTTILNDLNVGGTQVSGFDPATLTYTHIYSEGSDRTIGYELADPKQTVEIDSTVTEQATIVFVKVIAEAGPNVSSTYIITLVQEQIPIDNPDDPNHDATLQNITVNGADLEGFDSKTVYYSRTLDEAEWTVVGIPTQDAAVANTEQSELGSGVVQFVITVTAPDGETTQQYTVVIVATPVVQPEPDPSQCTEGLEDILVGGTSWNEVGGTPAVFNADKFNYSLQLPDGTTEFPEVTGSSTADCVEITYSEPELVDERTQDVTIIVRGHDNNDLTFDKAVYTVRLVLPVPTPEVNPDDCLDQLEGILVGGDDWNSLDTISEPFSADITDYTIRLPQETADFPTVEGFVADPENSCLIITKGKAVDLDERNRIEYIIVQGRDNNNLTFEKTVYIVRLVLPASEPQQPEEPVLCTDTLENIFVGSVEWSQLDSVSAPFTSGVAEYDVYLAEGTKDFPIVEGYLSDPDNSCLVLNEVTVIEIDSANQDAVINIDSYDSNSDITQLTYTVHMHILPFSDASIQDIDIDGEPLAGFRSDSMYYVVNLPVGTREYFQTLECYMNEEHAAYDTIRLDNDEVFDYDAHYQIHTTAQSGDTLNYFIDFVVAKSDTADLSMIYFTDSVVEHQTLDDYQYVETYFDPAVTSYTVVLPRGSKEWPAVSYELESQYSSAVVDTLMHDSINGTLTITVTAEDSTVKSYMIVFGVEISTKALLDDVTLELHFTDTVTFMQIDNFDPRTFNYLQPLPYGISTQTQVKIYYDVEQGITVQEQRGATLADTTYVTVTAEDGVTTNVYKLVFAETRSSNANPLMLYLDGVAMDTTELVINDSVVYFADAVYDSLYYEYHVVLPSGMIAMPEVTVLEGDTQQVIVVTPVDSAMTTVVTVTAGAGRPTNEYTIFFETAKYGYNTLDDLLVNGVTVEGFRPDSNDYVIYYPALTPIDSVFIESDITWVAAHPTEEVSVTQQDSLTYLVTVTAENGSANTYVLNIVIRLSDNALLDSIIVNGSMIPDFDPHELEYTYYLYKGQQVTDIVAVPQDTSANVTVLQGAAGEEYTLITVIAEDDSTTVTYKVWFEYLDIDISSEASMEDVCLRHMGGNIYKAASMKKNVQLCIYDLAGRLLQFVSVPVIEANETLCEGNTGVEITLEAHTTYIYTFFNNQERRITRGKVMHNE